MHKIVYDAHKAEQVLMWCHEQFGSVVWSNTADYGMGWWRQISIIDNQKVESIVFDRKEDATLFALRWS